MRRNTASSRPSRLTVTRCRPASFERRGLAREQRAVGGERQVERLRRPTCAAAASCSTSTSMFLRSSGSPPVRRILRTPCAANSARQPRDLLEAQQRRMRQVRVVLVEHFLGHAVAAAEVAAVGDADAQVAQRPARRSGSRPVAGDGATRAAAAAQRRRPLVDEGNDAFSHGAILPAARGPCRCKALRGRQTQRAPSTSMQTPLDEGGLVAGQVQRGVGDVERGREAAQRDGGAGTWRGAPRSTGPPANSADRPVSGLNTGLMQFTRMLSGPSSAASDLLVVITAPLEPLYQVRPGRGPHAGGGGDVDEDCRPCWRGTPAPRGSSTR